MMAIKIIATFMSCPRSKSYWLSLKSKRPSHWRTIVQNRLSYYLGRYAANLATTLVIGSTSLMGLFKIFLKLNHQHAQINIGKRFYPSEITAVYNIQLKRAKAGISFNTR